ncbi:hypothetical protein QYF36_017373 [Acer negundo]|nr:hypothetical protein QYF36_017373 [Acer negundo]
MLGCLEKRGHANLKVSKLDSLNNESMGSSIVKKNKEVSKIGKGRVVEISGGSGVSTKVLVSGLTESGDETVLGRKTILGGCSCDKKGSKGIVKEGVSGLPNNVVVTARMIPNVVTTAPSRP